jgi:hypothetical protein
MGQAVEQVIPDLAGNYDLDGVSYDKQEHAVVVSGDSTREGEAGVAAAF